jgi:YaaC-like protein
MIALTRNPSIYLQGCVFKWQDLLNGSIDRYPLIINMSSINRIFLNERKSKNTKLLEHELTREYIFIYAMSMLARYRIENWATFIEGRYSDIIWNIQQYMTATQSIFPNLILNQLSGEQNYFYPLEPDLMGFAEVKVEELDWVL